jgi:hypothetical protein
MKSVVEGSPTSKLMATGPSISLSLEETAPST